MGQVRSTLAAPFLGEENYAERTIASHLSQCVFGPAQGATVSLQIPLCTWLSGRNDGLEDSGQEKGANIKLAPVLLWLFENYCRSVPFSGSVLDSSGGMTTAAATLS